MIRSAGRASGRAGVAELRSAKRSLYDSAVDRMISVHGMNPAKLKVFCELFDRSAGATTAPPGWVHAANGTGTLNMQVAGSKGGLARLSTGANESYSALSHVVPIVAAPGTSNWCMICDLALPTTPDAETKALMGLYNLAGNKMIQVGFLGALSLTNWIVQYDGVVAGSAILLGGTIGNARHRIEVSCRGASTAQVLRACLDGSAPTLATMASAPADAMFPYCTARNYHTGGAPTSQSMDMLGMFIGVEI